MDHKIKPKRCKVCQTIFEPSRPLQSVCAWSCAKAHADKLKANKAKQEKKVLKEKLKTLSEYEADAKKAFQKWIRLRDKDLPCISCDNSNTNDWAGGHFYSAGMYSGLMFDERNCHKQCNTHCNKHLSGNLLEYRKGLIKRYGNAFVEDLDNISNSKRDYKYTKAELIAKKLKYDILIKEMK
jgi:hypothetical protein